MNVIARARALIAIVAAGALASCGDGRTVLVIYSPHGKELLEHYEFAFEKVHPTVDVQWLDIGSQEILDRVRAEKVNPQADVWFGAPSEMFERAANENLFLTYRPTWADAVDAGTHDAKDRWYGTYLTPEVIAYNRDAVKPEEAPADWDALLDPKWKGKIVIRDPVASGTMRAIFGAIILRSIAQTGKSDSGFAWLRALDAQTREYALNPTILYQKLGRQEGVITLYNMPDIATLEARTKIPIAWKVPTSGTPVLVDAIAIMKGSRHRELAQQYYEFVTSRNALRHAADSLYRIPVRTDLPLDSLPRWIREAKTGIVAMPMNRQLLADSLNSWMRRWDNEIRNSSKRQ
ncbi:MAG TPA: extracellular solute-binding protein [Gemmatimonadaceae bacterium]|nr:extracellular solute-binding protein [Gemmatimonadaceae bacterium]